MDQINFFKCLADETRFNIVMLVLGNNEQCVCDLTEKLQLSQPKISRHLALLRSSGLLQDRRQGQWVYYSLNPIHVRHHNIRNDHINMLFLENR
jgi:ArsR family transcriptional regulator